MVGFNYMFARNSGKQVKIHKLRILNIERQIFYWTSVDVNCYTVRTRNWWNECRFCFSFHVTNGSSGSILEIVKLKVTKFLAIFHKKRREFLCFLFCLCFYRLENLDDITLNWSFYILYTLVLCWSIVILMEPLIREIVSW